MENTDEKLQHQLKMQKVREMKNPTILMNTKDLETFIKEVGTQVNNFKVGASPTYEGLPIIARDHIEQGNIIIYDDVWQTSDRPLKDYPKGTKAKAIGGGHWIKNERGWKWCNSHCSFPTPGGDWNGMVSLPNCT